MGSGAPKRPADLLHRGHRRNPVHPEALANQMKSLARQSRQLSPHLESVQVPQAEGPRGRHAERSRPKLERSCGLLYWSRTQQHPSELLHYARKNNFQVPPVLNFVLGSPALWHSNTRLRDSKRGRLGIQAADTSSGRADTRSARRQSWSGPVGYCSGVGHNSVLLYSSSMPGKVTFRPPPVSTSREPRREHHLIWAG